MTYSDFLNCFQFFNFAETRGGMDRYKVAIVDDDELSLDNLVFGLQKFENFHLEGTARNGVSEEETDSKSASRFALF